MAMVFTLVEVAKEWLTDRSQSMHDKMTSRLRQQADVHADLEEEAEEERQKRLERERIMAEKVAASLKVPLSLLWFGVMVCCGGGLLSMVRTAAPAAPAPAVWILCFLLGS